MAGEKASRYSIQTIEKALKVLETLSGRDSLSLIELAALLNQPKSSLFRIIQTLEKHGYISRSDTTGKYCIGYKPLEIAGNFLAQHSLRNAALHEMTRLNDKYGDTVNLGVLKNGEVFYAEIIEGKHPLRMSDHVGAKAPFHSTAVGKAIAAHLPERDVQELIRANGLPAVTPRTIQDPEVFRSELACVRRDGYAVDDEENVLGARCVAAPIFNMHGDVVGAISLSGPIQRLSDAHMRQIALDVRQAAVHISEKLGYMRSQ